MNEPSTNITSMDEAFLNKLDSIIEENLEDTDFGVEKLAEEMAISRSQLHRKLQAINGKSASRYIRSYKLNKAKVLLEAKSARVSEISTDLGFSNSAYFAKVYTEEFGYNPSQTADHQQVGTEDSVPSKKNNYLWYVVGILLLSLTGVLYYNFIIADDYKNSIAVLPFNNYSSDKQYDYLSDGVTEDIIGQLASIPQLKVISRTSSSLYKDTDKTIKTIADELEVKNILEGSIRKEGDKIRIVTQLIDAEKDENIWVETYELPARDILSVPVEISRKIAETLKGRFSKDNLTTAAHFENLKPGQYEQYMRARFLEYQYSKEVTYSAIQLYKKLIEADPTFGPAYSGIAACYIILGTWTAIIDTQTALENIQPNIKQAKALAPDFFHTHAADGMTKFFFLQQYEEAEEELKRAIELDPSKSIVRAVYIHYLNMMGRFQEAKKQWTILNQHDPNSFWNKAFAGETYALNGEFNKSINFYKKAVSDVPYHPLLHDRLAWSYLLADSVQQSINVLENAIQQFNIKSPSMLAYLGIGYHKNQEPKKEKEVIEELKKMCRNDQPNCAGWVATYYAGINKSKEAKKWLSIAIKNKDVRLIWLKVDPYLNKLGLKPNEIL